jgi:hypothetical protein
MAKQSFSASASGWGLSASASGSYSDSIGQNSQTQSSFESSSNKSFIITYGGAPGSFGPNSAAGDDSAAGAADWGAWARTVDLQPVPVNYALAPIGSILPKYWANASSVWYAAETALYGDLEALYGSHKIFFFLKEQSLTHSLLSYVQRIFRWQSV